MSVIEDANKFVNDHAELKSGEIDSHKAINIIDELLFEIAKRDEVVEVAKGLLSAASCPECDGSGGKLVEVMASESGCCGNTLPTGECCGNAVEVQIQGFELEQCQWCYEVSKLNKGGEG